MKDGTSKSLGEIEKYLGVVDKMLSDFASLFPRIELSIRRDFSTICKRTRAEGIKFLTIQLPLVGKMYDLCLNGELFQPIPGFSRYTGYPIPQLFSGLGKLVVALDGTVAPHASELAIRCIRQICFLFYKLEIPYDETTKTAVLQAFVETQKELASGAAAKASDHTFDRTRRLLADTLKGFNFKDIKPSHGPGAVATGEQLEQKWKFQRLFKSLNQKYPYYEYFVVGTSHLLDEIKQYRSLERHDYPQAKLTTVPKDSRGPRIISMEPLELQFMQQGLMRKLVPYIESHPLTRGHVNFTDQTVNQRLALSSSTTLLWATLDMKDASDRVSEDLIWWLFADLPDLRSHLMALRSHFTCMPDGSKQRLYTFAPMGSAICFPIEAIVFWSLCVTFLQLQGMTRSMAVEFVYVYGDDIIIPTAYALNLCDFLESIGLKVNRSKSCISGRFRESCGVDAYNGIDVTPIRLKQPLSQRPKSGTLLLHYTSFANHCWRKGYVKTAQYVWAELENIWGPLPYGHTDEFYPCRTDCLSWEHAHALNLSMGKFIRSNDAYQRWEIKAWNVITSSRQTSLTGWSRLLRDLVTHVGDRPDLVHLRQRCQIRKKWNRMPSHWHPEHVLLPSEADD